MSKRNIFKRASVALVAVAAAVLMTGGGVNAIPYNGDNTVASPVPAFNVFTGNLPAPAPAGGEQNFYQGRVPVNGNQQDSSTQYGDPVNTDCTDGKVIQMRVYVHNGASVNGNNGGNGPSVAHGTKVKVALPGNQASNFSSTATISANNAATVSDGLTINCNGQSVKLQYIAGSATQYSKGTGVVALPDTIVSSGASIRSQNVDGDVWGCWDDRVYVTLAAKVVTTPPQPEKTAQCDLMDITASDRKVKVSQFKYTANNANFKQAVINWGDNTSTTVTNANEVVGKEHSYSKDGKYQVSITVTFNAGSQTITSGGPGTACAKQVTFTPNQPPTITTPPSTPGSPTSLVNVGPGSTAAAFAVATVIGTLAYRRILASRLS